MKREKGEKRKTIGIFLDSTAVTGGGFQYEKLLAEAFLNNKNVYNLIILCNHSYWINWCIKNGIEFATGCHFKFEQSELKLIYKFPRISAFYYSHFSAQGKSIRKMRLDILVFGQHEEFWPDYSLKQVGPIHDLMHRYETGFPERGNAQAEDLRIECELNYLNGIMTDSTLGVKHLRDSYGKSMNKRLRIKALPFIPATCVMEDEYIGTPSKYIFYPAQFWQHKNHINLIKAVHMLKDKIADIHLVLVGSEKNSKGLVEKYISDNQLGEYVSIYGFVTDRQIMYLYKHAVCMVMPSFYGPTNIPPLEAMTYGCPVAVSNNYAMGEQVGDAGLLFNPNSVEEIAECIKKIWTDSKLRRDMIQKGYEQIRKWGKKDFERELLLFMDELLKH